MNATAGLRIKNPCFDFQSLEQRYLLSVAVHLVDVPISAAAKAADPTLNDLRTIDVQLQVTGGDDWLASDLRLALSTGSFYNPGAGGDTPNTGLWSVFPYLEFDTWVAAPGFGNASLLGRKQGAGSALFSPSEINVAWGDLADTGDGTWTIARLTLSNNAVGDLTGNVFAQSNPGTGFPFDSLVSPLTSSISGKVYNDLNGNGKQGEGEPNLIKWQVFIDTNNNGQLDSNEISVKTNNRGEYRFINPGDNAAHRIRVRLHDGFRRSQPGNGSYNVGITIGTIAAGKVFGVTQRGMFSGVVFQDDNGNGAQDSGEPGLSGWRVFIDKDGDAKYDKNESSLRTTTDGAWAWDRVLPVTYNVGVTQVEGYARTTPSGKLLTVTVGNGQVVTGNLFGEQPGLGRNQAARISGAVFQDSNGNALRDAGESGLSGWRVFIDRDGDSRFDSSETTLRTAADGSWAFDNLQADSYRIGLTQVSGFERTTPPVVIVDVVAGQESSGHLFGQMPV